MSPLRPALTAASRGYVCTSCATKLQHPRLFPAFTRSLANKATGRARPVVLPKQNDEVGRKVKINYFEQDEEGKKRAVNPAEEDDLAERLNEAKEYLRDGLDQLGQKDFKGDVEGTFEEQLRFFDALDQEIELGQARKPAAEEDVDDLDFDERHILGGLSEQERRLFDKMLANFEKRSKNRSDRALDDDETDLLEGLTEKERQLYNAMQESLAKVAEQELFNEDEIEEFERKVISKPSGRETSALEDGIASASLEKELGETELPRADRSVLEDLAAKDSREPRSGRRRRNIKAQNSEPRLKGTDISIPRTTFPREGQAYISRLNEALEKSLFDPKKHRKELWRWYSLSRKTLASDFGLVPAPTWKLLWDEFSVDALDNPDRMAHIIDLAEGMQAANFPLKPDQTLLYMEALFVEDDEAEALQLWESSRSSLTLEDETAGAYWALGVRMLSEMKQPARAQEAADMLLGNLGAVKEVRALLPLIRAWSEFPYKTANQIAWAMYIRFKLWKGDGMEMQDYDDVAAIFLAAQQTDLALAVFRDMMLTGDEMAKQYDSVTLFQRLVGVKSTKALKSFQLAPEETSWRSSEHLSLLPAKFRNKFFFGSWIKKLVGEEQIDWAAQVVELMSQKGIKPSATYLNGIIGAWFRSGIQRNIEKGTTLAWKMISARLDFVRQRTQNSAPLELSNPIRANKTIGKDDYIRPSSLSYAGAQATLETFTVLIEHYQKINHKGRVQELLATLKAAQIRPTTPFMNNLLELGTAIHNRPWVWSLYERFVQQDAVPATQYTFAILWKNMKDHVDPVINRNKVGYPSPRLLFSEMGRAPIFKTEQLARELYDQIILCFGLSDDQIGTAVALRAMQNIHGIYPNEATVRSVVLQLAKVGVTNVKGYRTRRLNINKDTQRRIAEIGNVMKALKEERVKALEAEGVDAESLRAQEKSEESLKLLISLLRFAMEGRMKTDSNLRASAGVGGVDYLRKEACKDMDVELSSW